MPLSVQGNAVLSKMFYSFRTSYVEKNPGCNENDVERGFLHIVLHSLVFQSSTFTNDAEIQATEILIDKIR
jgi:hypothetical protein